MSSLTMSAAAKRAALAVMLMTVTACQQTPVSQPVTPTPVASPKTSPLAACAATAASPGPQVLLQNQPAPDDLVFDNAGRPPFSDNKTGFVSALNGHRASDRNAC